MDLVLKNEINITISLYNYRNKYKIIGEKCKC